MENSLSFDMASFQACINMLKINTKPEIYKMLIAVLCDFQPKDNDNRKKTIRYVNILLGDHVDLAELLLSFLPDTTTSSPVPSIKAKSPRQSVEKTTHKQRVKIKTKKRAGQLLAQAASSKKTKVPSKSCSTTTTKMHLVSKQNRHNTPNKQIARRHSQTPVMQMVVKKVQGLCSNSSVITDLLQRSHTAPPVPVASSSVIKTGTTTTSSCLKLNPLIRSEKQIYQENAAIVGTTDPSGVSQITDMTYPYMTQCSPSFPVLLEGQRGSYIAPASNLYGVSMGYSGLPFGRPNITLPCPKGIKTAPFCQQFQNARCFQTKIENSDKSYTAEDYLASHTIEKKLTGPDSMSPFLRTKPTCIVNPVDESFAAFKKSPRRNTNKSVRTNSNPIVPNFLQQSAQQSEYHKVGTFPGVVRINSNPTTSRPVRIHHPLPNNITNHPSSQQPLQQSRISARNLSAFPYTHQMTLPDGQTQHLRIQGSGSITNHGGFPSTPTETFDTEVMNQDDYVHAIRSKPGKR